MEMISSILYQLTRNLTPEQIREGGFDAYFVDHTTGIYPQSAAGIPWSAATFQSKGDPITDLFEDMAAEQKARSTYDNLLRLIDDPDVREPLKFLREREVVHFQRFGDALSVVQSNLDAKKLLRLESGVRCAAARTKRSRSLPSVPHAERQRHNCAARISRFSPNRCSFACCRPGEFFFCRFPGKVFRLMPFIFRKFYILFCLPCLFLHIFCTI